MKTLLTTRVTVLEAFRQFINCDDNEDTPWINEENVIQTVMGIETYNVKAAYGTAGHSIIENASAYKTNTGYQVKDFMFTDTQVAPLLKFRSEHPLMTREIPLAKYYQTSEFDLIITGTCDHLEGLIVRDTKFKFSSFDVAEFMESFQWKAYLDMIGLKHFVYDFFKVTGFDSMADLGKSKIGNCESMPLRAYSGMEDDIQSVLEEFAEWISFKKLQQYLVIDNKKAKKIIAGNPKLRKFITV